VKHGTCKTIFVAGTDTDVGKTYVAALIAAALRQAGYSVGVYKPVESGCVWNQGQLVARDAEKLWVAAGKPRTLQDVCPQRFQAPLAPPVAAIAEGRAVDRNQLSEAARCWEETCDVLIIEGAGGLFSPIAAGMLNIDLVSELPAARLLVVAANRLGVIHHTLATCLAAAHRGKTPCGIVLSSSTPESDESTETNAAQIEQYGDVPVWGHVPFAAVSLNRTLIQRLVN
jgi:dethiobiotin synthetase